MEFVKCVGHPEEFYNLLRFPHGRPAEFYTQNGPGLSSSLKTCYKYLNQTSRSFAAVIQALDGDIRLVESLTRGGPLFQELLSHCSTVDTPRRIMGSLL